MFMKLIMLLYNNILVAYGMQLQNTGKKSIVEESKESSADKRPRNAQLPLTPSRNTSEASKSRGR